MRSIIPPPSARLKQSKFLRLRSFRGVLVLAAISVHHENLVKISMMKS